MLKGAGGQLRHRRLKPHDIGVGYRVAGQCRQNCGRGHGFKARDGIVDRAIFGGDDFALFGNADAPLQCALGLRKDGAKG